MSNSAYISKQSKLLISPDCGLFPFVDLIAGTMQLLDSVDDNLDYRKETEIISYLDSTFPDRANIAQGEITSLLDAEATEIDLGSLVEALAFVNENMLSKFITKYPNSKKSLLLKAPSLVLRGLVDITRITSNQSVLEKLYISILETGLNNKDSALYEYSLLALMSNLHSYGNWPSSIGDKIKIVECSHIVRDYALIETTHKTISFFQKSISGVLLPNYLGIKYLNNLQDKQEVYKLFNENGFDTSIIDSLFSN